MFCSHSVVPRSGRIGLGEDHYVPPSIIAGNVLLTLCSESVHPLRIRICALAMSTRIAMPVYNDVNVCQKLKTSYELSDPAPALAVARMDWHKRTHWTSLARYHNAVAHKDARDNCRVANIMKWRLRSGAASPLSQLHSLSKNSLPSSHAASCLDSCPAGSLPGLLASWLAG